MPCWPLHHFSLSYLALFFVALLTWCSLSIQLFIPNVSFVKAGAFHYIPSAGTVPGPQLVPINIYWMKENEWQYWMLSLFCLNFYLFLSSHWSHWLLYSFLFPSHYALEFTFTQQTEWFKNIYQERPVSSVG